MAKIRHICIENFRCIKKLSWYPHAGLNCLIGPGDSGKSTVLDAIDLCLGPRQSKAVSDSDFYNLDTASPLIVDVTVGKLDDELKQLDKYDQYLRGYRASDGSVVDEPQNGFETVLTVRLKVGADLDPIWSLYSERAELAGREKNLTWGDRILLAGTRIGGVSDYHLSWRKGAVLNRLADERPDTSIALAEATRAARAAFGEKADHNLEDTLAAVTSTAGELGVRLEGDLQALLNAHSISLSGGTIALHDGRGVPLSSLGLGSGRLLVAGLLNQAITGSNLVLVDELEHGLEPHRIIRFLGALGAKQRDEPIQVFITSHSPVVLRELDETQLFVLRESEQEHTAKLAKIDANSQGTLRRHAEAFFAKSVLLCEGASEIGFVRGLDQYRSSTGRQSVFAAGLGLLDASGVTNLYQHAPTLQSLGYRVGSFRDDDAPPNGAAEAGFLVAGGTLYKWQPAEKIEQAIFRALPDDGVIAALELAIELHGVELISAHIESATAGTAKLQDIQGVEPLLGLPPDLRQILTDACTQKRAWFKSLHDMERLARDVVGPHFETCSPEFKNFVQSIFNWAEDA
mgnify:CR=1 FL=1|tara:strand:- start:1499 stop:3217 length:1719 start_codon:yes stop_codon:yes gene_type:complete